jgi:nickel-dependent lactate racemase
MALLRYGKRATIELECGAGRPFECGAPARRPLADVPRAVAEALNNPLDYPPLARATTPGDRVAVALEPGLPRAAEVVAAVVQTLVDASVDPDGITVLVTRADEADDPRLLIPLPLRRRIGLATHDPGDRRQLAYLAAADSGEPILLGRLLHEADLVLPLGCVQGEMASGYFGIHGLLYPGFSDERTLHRFRAPGSPGGEGGSKSRRARRRALAEEADHVAWLLGVNFTIQLVPAAGDGVLDVLAGQSDAVARRARERYHAAWDRSVPEQTSLVVAAIAGGRRQQTWENLGRALEAALPAVEDGGAIAVCCELADEPGPAVKRIGAPGTRRAALKRINKDRPPDALPAAQLARALDRARVYLLSRLEPAVVEDLDMIYVAAPEELMRLARRHPTCTLLSDAPRAVVRCGHS